MRRPYGEYGSPWKVRNRSVFEYQYRFGSFWVRICGYGLSVLRYKEFPPMFSERNGHKKPVFKIGSRFRVFFIKPFPTVTG